ncbi:MAG: HAMP domain-containing protein [Proteobacteria bacterium]|nr:HAMP domain-containing protein [Pseudomonadota bacterium]
MKAFKDISIKRKLTAVIMLTSCTVLLIASTGFILSELLTSRRTIVQELSTIAQIIGNNSTAALVFDDKMSAEESLSALSAKPNVVSAYIFRKVDGKEGGPFAGYEAGGGKTNKATPGVNKEIMDTLWNEGIKTSRQAGQDIHFLDGYVDVYTPIVLDDEVIGIIYLRSNLEEMYAQLNLYLIVASFVTFLSFLVALILSAKLQRVISQPILQLANTMKRVSTRSESNESSYEIKAEKYGDDELGILTDGFNRMLTQIQAREEGLRAARHQAEMANRAKTEFLANMSHELRTPLNAILGFSELIKNELLGPLGNQRYRDYAGDIHESGTHLLQVITDILDISKVEAGKLELHEEAFDVGDLIGNSVRLIAERAKEAGLSITVKTESGLRAIYADERLVKQCLINLLSNAVKFTPEGGYIIVRALNGLEGTMDISVADTGIGIEKDEIPRVLAPFGQVDGSLSRKYEGTGLGLPLVKSFVELHGGSLDIQSGIGVGTTVTIRFPAERVLEAPDEVVPEPAPAE